MDLPKGVPGLTIASPSSLIQSIHLARCAAPSSGLESSFVYVFAGIADYISEKYDLLPVFIPLNTQKDTKVSDEITGIIEGAAKEIGEKYK